ncbi:type II toxin-antitoxin system RelE/ParE family toxin [Phenylobacterium aquaticum]|uniref:type II toxin-antitoxin system RelE/ParE family toxin n=1 Tax=Phenylobacterium aquaticum TaxID=1763816 RepID=UPI001F5CBB62|nr:type II toxin-antitoxin system RelE/ParE family toxin [Phenylobacterium aquaticum]MCI3133698.1 type II toxin-antitoxin system RelE/ParE family toxin [Phenylobacterium aquaticum]
MRRLILSLEGRVDVAGILARSGEVFGQQARRRYSALLDVALRDLLDDPKAVGSQLRPDLAAGVYVYHLRHSRQRARVAGTIVSDPRHLILYEFDAAEVRVMRILHEAMDLARHIPARGQP